MKESKTLIYLKNFIESNYNDLDLFKKACNKNINLEIYLCLPEKELVRILQEYKNQGINTVKELSSRLVNDQPAMNKTLDIYEKAVVRIQLNIDNYIKYHGFKMANSAGNAEDWYTEFLIKYWYNVQFYKIRWFFPETLKKESKVKYKTMLYKDFLYQSKAIISNEKRLKAHQAAKRKQDSLFKTSLDKDFKDSNKNLKDTIGDQDDISFSTSEFQLFKYKILVEVSKNQTHKNLYNKIVKALQLDEIKQNTTEGKIILIYAYKCGMESLKLYDFIHKLSTRQKKEYGISSLRLIERMKELALKPTAEFISYSHDKKVAHDTYEIDEEKYNKYCIEQQKKGKRKKKKVNIDE